MKLQKLPTVTFVPAQGLAQKFFTIYLDGMKLNLTVMPDIVALGLAMKAITYNTLEAAYELEMGHQNIGDPADRSYIASEIIKFIKSVLPP
jgi:hypothetical protein